MVSKIVYLDNVKAKVKELKLINTFQCRPCTPSEIDKLEGWIHGLLPMAYKEFLLWMGHNDGGFLQGSERLYYDLTTIQEGAVDLLEENGFPEPFPPDAFVFFMHQGYQFAYFRLSEGDDPPVYYYLEGQPTIERVKEHYSGWLLEWAEVLEKLRNCRKGT